MRQTVNLPASPPVVRYFAVGENASIRPRPFRAVPAATPVGVRPDPTGRCIRRRHRCRSAVSGEKATARYAVVMGLEPHHFAAGSRIHNVHDIPRPDGQASPSGEGQTVNAVADLQITKELARGCRTGRPSSRAQARVLLSGRKPKPGTPSPPLPPMRYSAGRPVRPVRVQAMERKRLWKCGEAAATWPEPVGATYSSRSELVPGSGSGSRLRAPLRRALLRRSSAAAPVGVRHFRHRIVGRRSTTTTGSSAVSPDAVPTMNTVASVGRFGCQPPDRRIARPGKSCTPTTAASAIAICCTAELMLMKRPAGEARALAVTRAIMHHAARRSSS